jgi:DNA-binding CsgD family transcriptional regulator
MAMFTQLRGRDKECEALDRLLAAVHEGESCALVVRGDPGMGKTALLDYAAERASGCRVVRAAGVQSEMELAFSGLHQLCAPLLDRVERLPTPQRDALATAFGLSSGVAPDRFLVGLAVLSLLSEVADERPLLCAVDDAQWLDRASLQALAFVSRRLVAESVALVFAARTGQEERELARLPELMVEGLGDRDARALLASVIRGPLDDHVRDRLVAETRGNPLALLELPRGLKPAELAGGFGLLDKLGLSGRIEESFRRRVEPLPAETRRLLLVAAAEPVGDPALLWRAVARLGIGVEAAAPAESAGLLTIGARVTFYHPLVRSAVYRAAPLEERQDAHRALAEATDAEVDPDRRAWHRAQAAPRGDEAVAEELERSAGRAQARGGLAAAAAFLERAAALTLEPARRAQRALAAAQVKHEAGASDPALRLLAIAEAGPLDERDRARAERLRAQLAFVPRRSSDAPPLLLRAARRLEALDPTLARETYLEALAAAITAGRRDVILEVAQTVRAALQSQQPRAAELLLDGQARLIIEGAATATASLKRALRTFRSEYLSGGEEIRGSWLFACQIAMFLWDDDHWYVLSAVQVERTREEGALTLLPVALEVHAAIQVHTGELLSAAALLEESDAITQAIDSVAFFESSLLLVGLRGREPPALERIEVALKEASEREDEGMIAVAEYARATLYNGLGRYPLALRAAQRSCEHHEHGGAKVLSELVEAAARSGEQQLAAAGLERLAGRTRPIGTDWALGVEARSRALLSEDEGAEALYQEAIERLGRTRVRSDLARARLLYGEWLRRARRRLEAREQLRTAHELFDSMGAEAFAARAERELRASGVTARKRVEESRGELTAQEAQIARLVRDGLSNPEVGARLFISPRTVEYHLHKVFVKLGISSRSELDHALPRESSQPPAWPEAAA